MSPEARLNKAELEIDGRIGKIDETLAQTNQQLSDAQAQISQMVRMAASSTTTISKNQHRTNAISTQRSIALLRARVSRLVDTKSSLYKLKDDLTLTDTMRSLSTTLNMVNSNSTTQEIDDSIDSITEFSNNLNNVAQSLNQVKHDDSFQLNDDIFATDVDQLIASAQETPDPPSFEKMPKSTASVPLFLPDAPSQRLLLNRTKKSPIQL